MGIHGGVSRCAVWVERTISFIGRGTIETSPPPDWMPKAMTRRQWPLSGREAIRLAGLWRSQIEGDMDRTRYRPEHGYCVGGIP